MRERGLTPEDIKNTKDLEKLPMVDKEMMRDNPQFIAKNSWRYFPHRIYSGGSTGRAFGYLITPLVTYCGREYMERGFSWAGWERKDRIATLTGGGLGVGDLMLDCVSMSDKVMGGYVKRIREGNISFYRGVPTALATFAEYVKKEGLDMKKKAVFTTSEMLFPTHRKLINEVLGTCFDGYGASDGGSSAYECDRHQGWHIAKDRFILELTKGEELVPVGDEGIVTCTDLYNYAMPFIRYRSNDLAVASDMLCECGRSLPLLSRIKGRTTDVIRTDSTVFNGTELANHILGLELPMVAFQIVQKSRDELRINVHKKEQWGSEHEKMIMDAILRYDPALVIEFEYVEKIAKTPAGKSRYVVGS